MAWAVAADIYNQFPQTFVDKLTGGDADVLTALIDAADAELAAKWRKRYPSQVTLRSASTTAKTIVVLLTIRKLCNRNPYVDVAKNLVADIDNAIALMNEIASATSDVSEWARPAGMKTGNMQFENHGSFNDWITERDELES